MQGALVIFAAMIVIGLILFLTDKKYYRHHHGEGNREGSGAAPSPTESPEKVSDNREPEVCCGLHLVCEKTGLSPVDDEIIYYDDEELDRFAGRTPESYNTEEREEFRDVLLTLLPQDVAGWARSITLRKIELPEDVREELLMIVSELREEAK